MDGGACRAWVCVGMKWLTERVKVVFALVLMVQVFLVLSIVALFSPSVAVECMQDCVKRAANLE